jgi:DNA-binding transcriptional LysR family regulator
VDVGVASERVERGGLSYQRFFEDEIVLVVPASHPWAGQASVSPAQLQHERFVMREAQAGTNLTVLEALALAGVDVDSLEVVLTLENSEAIVMAVEEEIGLGFVPRVAVERFINLGRIALLEVEGLDLRRWLYMIDNQHRPRTPASRAFWEYIGEESADDLWSGLLPAPAHVPAQPGQFSTAAACD